MTDIPIITGGGQNKPKKLDPIIAVQIADIYAKWRAAGVTRILVSARTFTNHLDHNILIAGPWEWRIRDDIPYGDVRLYGVCRQRIGTMSISDVAIH
ncbi:MAG: hypothetical protein ACT4O5_15715 [Gammaproteobacteria bacterium]